MDQKNCVSSITECRARFRLKTSQPSVKTLKTKLPILLEMALSPVFKLAFSNFDDIFSALTLGSLLLLLAYRLVASPILSTEWLLVTISNYGWKTAFASPENAPTYLHAHKLMRKVWQDMPNAS